MIRASLTLIALAGLALPTLAQEIVPPEECANTTLFQALGLEDNPDCQPLEEGEGDEAAAGEEGGESEKNPVSVAAKLPGNNREAAQAHASEMSGGNAGGNGHGKSDASESISGNGNGGGNGKGNGKN